MTKRGEIVARGILYLFIGLATMGYAGEEFMGRPLFTAYEDAKGKVTVAQIKIEPIKTADAGTFMPQAPYRDISEKQINKMMIPWLRWRLSEYFSCEGFYFHLHPKDYAYEGWGNLPLEIRQQFDRSFAHNFIVQIQGHKLDDMKEKRRQVQEELNCKIRDVDGSQNP